MKSLRNIYLLFAILLAALFPAGCTHNDGDIGKQFGLWKLNRMTDVAPDGTSVSLDEDARGVYWAFQNTTIEMKRVDERHNEERTFGNYRIADQTLFLDFSDPDLTPLPGMGLPKESQLAIIRLSHSELVLSYSAGNAAGSVRYYYFEKW